ncbi:hypothetical protein PR048_020600 [Dryococelus australis]|uniref:Uncharacterized protein n=1 Tax=Dryococelus australis TaxID=614101 RepID=A0ABQ9H6P4_9NEOP|nr:hypothetical protein PR048_020600 [Dryococelus australis]
MSFQHCFSIKVWCSTQSADRVIHFLGRNQQFLQEELPLLLEDIPLAVRRRTIFHHDVAPPHFHRAVDEAVFTTWPLRWPDHLPLDYCVWGWMKDIVYQRTVQTRGEHIMHAATEIKDSRVQLHRRTRAATARCCPHWGWSPLLSVQWEEFTPAGKPIPPGEYLVSWLYRSCHLGTRNGWPSNSSEVSVPRSLVSTSAKKFPPSAQLSVQQGGSDFKPLYRGWYPSVVALQFTAWGREWMPFQGSFILLLRKTRFSAVPVRSDEDEEWEIRVRLKKLGKINDDYYAVKENKQRVELALKRKLCSHAPVTVDSL